MPLPPGLYARFQTSQGDFTVRLFDDLAPNTVQNFVDLAEGRKGPKPGTPFYDGLVFHRVIDGFMIQGGCPEGSGRGDPGYRFPDEFHPKLRHNKPGILSMANAGPNTNGSQFFITVTPTPHLDNRHSVFGEVAEGYHVVEKISLVPRDGRDRPLEPVVMRQVRIERVS